MHNPDHAVQPAPGRFLVPRPTLMATLDKASHYSLTLLLASAGCGKSTLLQQWRAAHPQWQMASLSLTWRDADPVSFFRRLDAAVRDAVPAFAGLSYNDLSAEAALPAAELADTLALSLAAVPGPLYVLVDEFQFADHALVHDVLARVVQQAPASQHWVIACRGQPRLALARLQLEDRVLVIDREQLRFNARELDTLCEHYYPALAREGRERLLALTEGWAAGIKLALLARSPDQLPGASSFCADQPGLVDYFAEVVLHDLPPAVHQFLLATAMLERFCEPLCDALLGSQGASAPVLLYLQSRELFVQPVEEHPGWWRYHMLFQDFLLTRLQAGPATHYQTLHRRAAQWLYQQGDDESALHHARQAADAQFFEQLLTECCFRWHQRGDYSRIMQALLTLPDEQVLPNTDLCGPLIGALILSRRFNQARYYIDESMKLPAASRRGRFADAWLPAFLDSMLLFFQHDSQFRLDDEQAVLLASTGHHDIRAFSLAIIAYHALLHGQFDSALQRAQHAKDILARLGYRYLESYADLILVLCDRQRGRMLHAMQGVHDMFRRYQADEPGPAWVNAATAMAQLHYEMNQLEAARRLGEALLPRVSSSCATEVIASAYLTMSRLHHLAGETSRAQRLLQHLERILTLGQYQRFVSQLTHEAMRQAFLSGDHDRMAVLDETHGLVRRWQSGEWRVLPDYDERWERDGLALALLLWARRQYAEADEVLAAVVAMLRRQGASARALVADACRVAGCWHQGDVLRARQGVRDLIARYGLEAVNRTAFDEAPGLAALLADACYQDGLSLPAVYLSMFDSVLPRGATAAPVSPMVPLTTREQDILTLLRAGLSNREISERSGLAVTTIKWHVKNIFAKLGVASRAEAIARLARQGPPSLS